MSRDIQPREVGFDPTPEIFATDSSGGFTFPLAVGGDPFLATGEYDEVRLVLSLWHPSPRRSIDLDRAYVELRGSFDPEEQHWFKLAEIEPVVPPYEAGQVFDGWIVLPVFAAASAFTVAGGGFEARARLQVRATAYFVA